MPQPRTIYRFDCFYLDAADRLLYRSGELLPLPPKVFDTLLILLSNSRHVVTKEELTRQLWPDTFVADGTLAQNISLLRKVLGDGARWIENHPRRGYRFNADVHQETADVTVYRVPEPAPAADGASAAESPDAVGGNIQPASVSTRRWNERLIFRRWTTVTALLVLLASAGLLSLRRTPASIAASVVSSDRTLVRLTSTAGLNTDPALSPDGSLLAYASDRGGTSGFDVWVQPVGGGEPLRLTNSPGDETEPSFSPDGAQVVFSERDSAVIKAVGALGGEPRVVVRAEWARMPRFSPDGRWIVYWTGFLPTVVPRGLPGATGSIFIAPAEGGSAIKLAPHFASARYAIWSPDSRNVLFLGEQTASESTYDWYMASIEGGSVVKTGAIDAIRRLRLNGATPVPGGWRSADDAVVFATNETDKSNLWQIQVSRSTGRAVGSPERLTFGSAIERAPGVAASGRIAFASVVEKLGIWRIRLDPDTGAGIGAFERVTDGASNERLRNASRDGKVLSFISSRTGRDEVWIRDLESGREQQVTHAGAEDASLAPNGSTVAFSRRDSGRREIQIMEARALPSTLCEDCSVPADWSPDGKRLLFHRRLPSELIIYDRSSRSEAVAIRNEKWSLFQARFSPDGGWVAFHTANSPELRQVYAAPLSLSSPAHSQAWVPIVTDHGCHPNWSADGSLLYHFSFRDGAFCPWVQPIDRATRRPIGRPRVVRHLHEPRLRAAMGAAATNDVVGGYLYMTASETTGNIWMLDSRR
jgi:Tol biopolymer transport system component/DNA-binding winged helix-turn-helix (wHTH) protein